MMARSVKDLRELVCMSRLSMRDEPDEEDVDSRGPSRMSIAPTPVPREGHLDNMLQCTDAIIVSENLEHAVGVNESLSLWWNTNTNSVEFTQFWLEQLNEETRIGLMHLECDIIKKQLTRAFKVGKESGLVTDEDIGLFFKSVLREYPRRLCSGRSAQYRLLDILYTVCSVEKDESYRKLLTNVRCSTSNSDYAQWVLASRAFAVVSLCEAVVKFVCDANSLISTRPKSAIGIRPRAPSPLLLPSLSPSLPPGKPCIPERVGNPRSYGDNQLACDEEQRSASRLSSDSSLSLPSSVVSDTEIPLDTQMSVVTDVQRVFLSTKLGYVETLRYLLSSKRVEATVTDAQHGTLITASIIYKQPQVLDYLLTLSDGPRVDQSGVSGNTPLHIAARQGSVEMVQSLVLADAQINCSNSEADGAAPLHFAVMNGHVDVVQCLVNAGADSSVRMGTPAVTTPLSLAQDLEHLEICEILENVTKDKK